MSIQSTVKKYLERTNRPYSAIDITNNLSTNDNKMNKNKITKALEDLAHEESIKEKVNGKSKIYFADQNGFNELDENRIREIDEELSQLTEEFKEMETNLKSKEQRLKSMKSVLTLEEVSQKLNEVNQVINGLENRLKEIDSKAKDFDPELNNQIKTKRQTLVKEANKRKRMAQQMIESISDVSSKPKKALIEEMGVETDEEVGTVLPQN